MTLQKFLDNKYTKIQQLALTRLNCSYCNITSLEGIENLVNLVNFDCSYNRITSLAGIEHCVNLLFFDCSKNNLTSLKGIEKLDDNLIHLHCTENKLPYSSSEDLDIIIKEVRLEIKKENRKKVIGKLLNTNQ